MNYKVTCEDCKVDADFISAGFICPKCKAEWWVDG